MHTAKHPEFSSSAGPCRRASTHALPHRPDRLHGPMRTSGRPVSARKHHTLGPAGRPVHTEHIHSLGPLAHTGIQRNVGRHRPARTTRAFGNVGRTVYTGSTQIIMWTTTTATTYWDGARFPPEPIIRHNPCTRSSRGCIGPVSTGEPTSTDGYGRLRSYGSAACM